jgi:hypothetical protein
MSEAIMSLRGTGCILYIHRDKLVLQPKGLAGFYFRGLKGTKTIPYSSITAVQHKEPSILQGYLQFSLHGGKECTGGWLAACHDENTFLYYGKRELVRQAKDFIERKMGIAREPHSTPPAPSPMPTNVAASVQSPSTQLTQPASLVTELKQLAELRASGTLTEDEFRAAKAKVIS